MKSLLLVGCATILMLVLSCNNTQKLSMKKEPDYKDDKFEAGQLWAYKTRDGEENSTVQILKIDKYENMDAFVHITIQGLKMKNPMVEGGIAEDIGHIPMDKATLSESVTKLLNRESELPDFQEGYKQWEQEQGGVFTISVADVVSAVEEMVSGM